MLIGQLVQGLSHLEEPGTARRALGHHYFLWLLLLRPCSTGLLHDELLGLQLLNGDLLLCLRALILLLLLLERLELLLVMGTAGVLGVLGDDGCGGAVLVAHARGVHAVVVVAVHHRAAVSIVGVLVEVHEDVLYLRLLRGVHHHHYRLLLLLLRCYCVGGGGLGLVVELVSGCLVVVVQVRAVVRVERLRGRPRTRLLRGLLLGRGCLLLHVRGGEVASTSTAHARRRLPLARPLLLLGVLGEVSLRGEL
jgi:hypothetical protein